METITNPDGSKIITSTIGTNNRDFSTVEAWHATIPADLVAIKTKYIGLMYNDSEFTKRIIISARTVNSNFNVELRTAPGHSIYDNLAMRQGPVAYDRSKGVGVRCADGGYDTDILEIRCTNTIVEGIQFNAVYSGSKALLIHDKAYEVKVNRCLFKASPNHAGWSLVSATRGSIDTCLFIYDADFPPIAAINVWGGIFRNVGVVKPSNRTRGGRAFAPRYGQAHVVNCYALGFDNSWGDISTYTATSSNNAGDGEDAANRFSVKVAYDQLVQPNLTLANPSFRLKQTSVLQNAGKNLSDVSGTTDMYGYSRDENWDIGPVENVRKADKFVFTSTPTVGFVNQPSPEFVVGVNGFLEADVTVTLVSDDPAGVFTPATVKLTQAQPTASYTYTPSKSGNHTLTSTNDGSLPNPAAMNYLAGSVATALTWHNTANLTGRAGVAIEGVSVTVNGVVENPIVVTPTDSDGGTFEPATYTISKLNTVATFIYKGASGGVKSLTVSNNGGLTNPAAISATLKTLIAPIPTPSTDTLIVKSIGAGKDFGNVNDFAAWLNGLDLVVMKQNVIGEVYESMTVGSYTHFYPQVADTQYNAILQPVPGLEAFRWEETTDPLDYGTLGIELKLGAFAIRFGRGITVRNFRLDLPLNGSALSMQSTSSAGNGGSPKLMNNRIRVNIAAGTAISTGEYASESVFYDNLFIRESGDGPIISPSIFADIQRNTFAARGTGKFSTGAVVYNPDSTSWSLTASRLIDNAFVNVGPIAVANAGKLTNGVVSNNATDNTQTTPVAGIATAAAGALVNSNADYRPKVGSILEGTASTYAIDTLDIRGVLRGGLPDIGCIQGATRTPLPLVTITDTIVDGNDVIVSGTTKWAPTSGIAILLANASDPDGATNPAQKTVVLTSGAFSVKWEGLNAGNYDIPKITMTNAGGYNRTQTGGEIIQIIPLIANVVDGEEQSPSGGAPIIKVNTIAFDNKSLSVSGTIDKQGDPLCSLNIFIDPLPTGAAISPSTSINVFGNSWGIRLNPPKGAFQIRLVAVANGQTTTFTSPVKKLIDYTASIMLPKR